MKGWDRTASFLSRRLIYHDLLRAIANLERVNATSEKSCEQQRTIANDAVDRERELNDFFISEKWHRPYAEALRENDASKLPTLIAEAEDAIFDRHLELCTSPGSMEQRLDLQRAVTVLAQVKKTSCS